MGIKEIVDSLSYKEKKLLIALDDMGGVATPAEIMDKGIFDLEVEVMGSASWLNIKELATIESEQAEFYSIADRQKAEQGLFERRAVDAIGAAGGSLTMEGLAEAMPNGDDKIAVGWLKRKGLADIKKDGDSKILVLTELGKKALTEKMPDELLVDRLMQAPIPKSDVDPKSIKDLIGHYGLISEDVDVKKTIRLTDLGKEVASSGIELKEEVTQVTDTLIQSGKWKDVEIRKYDVQTFAPAVYPAKKHPLSRLGA